MASKPPHGRAGGVRGRAGGRRGRRVAGPGGWHTGAVRVPAALFAAAALVVGLGAPAHASEGSVPLEVAAFVTAPDGLIASLDDFFGPGADGGGIEFDDTTETGAVARVFAFSPEWLAGETTDEPVELVNQWAAPVSVGGKAIGVAVIWINPATVRPQLADFVVDPAFAEGLADLPADAWLVGDEPRGAWFVLAPPVLTPLVVGTSGISGETPLADYQSDITAAPAQPAAEKAADLGSALSVATIVGGALVVALALLVPLLWRRRKAASAEADQAEVAGHPPIT